MSDASNISKNEEESLQSNLRKETATKPDEKSYEYQDSLIILTDDTQDEIANLVTDNILILCLFFISFHKVEQEYRKEERRVAPLTKSGILS